MALIFEWDESKNRANVAKHGVGFEDAASVFGDLLSLTVVDQDHSSPNEERFITLGRSAAGHLLVVVHSDRGDAVRIMSARPATRRERLAYEEDA